MRRMIFSILSALLISSGFSTPAFSMELASGSLESPEMTSEMTFEDLAIFEAEEAANLESHELHYRPGRPGRPGYRGVQCKAVNRRGVAFYGRGPNMPAARDAALRSCYQVSRSCWMDGCRPF